jgi:thioredoxin reductase
MRHVLIVDAGRPRNAPATAAHGLLTQDGASPIRILAIARSQLARYETVEFRHAEVVEAASIQRGFVVRLAGGDHAHARRLLLAGGVSDQLPAISGLAELWGTGVLHCTYCHGYEVAGQPLALYGRTDDAMTSARLLAHITQDLLLLVPDPALIPATDRMWLADRGVSVMSAPLAAATPHSAGIALHFADGAEVTRRALFVTPSTRMTDGLAQSLGCQLDGAARVVVDRSWATTVPGVLAAGDIATLKKQVVTAAASGAEAAMAIHEDLSREDVGA